MSEPASARPGRRAGEGPVDPVGPDPDGTATRYEPEPPQARKGGRRNRRFWSPRRLPAALVAAVLVGAAGLLLFDVAAVRAGQPAMYWRRKLAEELAEQPLSETWVVVAACVAMALGLWFVVLALTPGLRSLLPMRRSAQVRAGLDKEAAALALRDRAMEVSGVQVARVRVGRSKARVRAFSHFRELDDVRDDLDVALGSGISQLGLSKPLSLKLRVRRPKKG